MIYFRTREDARSFARNVKVCRYRVVDLKGQRLKSRWTVRKIV